MFAFILVNYKTPQLVIDCLASLAPQIDGARDCAVVVDNLSGDDSAAIIQQAIRDRGWTWVTFVQSAVNGGFSAGNNLGMAAVDAEAYWLTNSDTIFRRDAVNQMQQALALHPEAGMISPRLEWPDEQPQISCFRPHSPITELMDAAKTGPIDKLFKGREVAIPVSDAPIRPQWTSFASVVLRQACVAQVGPMDEGFFMYYEDVDYGRRVTQAGWQILHWPAARVIHLRGGTSDVKAKTKARKRRPTYYYAARSRYLAKHYGKVGLWGANGLWLFGRAISKTRELLGNKAPHTCAHEAEDIWTNWRNPLQS